MIKIVESPLMTKLKKKYISLYCEVRRDQYPVEQSFLVTKIKFQEYIITMMFENPMQTREIINAYTKIKLDKTLQEKAIKIFQTQEKIVPIVKINGQV